MNSFKVVSFIILAVLFFGSQSSFAGERKLRRRKRKDFGIKWKKASRSVKRAVRELRRLKSVRPNRLRSNTILNNAQIQADLWLEYGKIDLATMRGIEAPGCENVAFESSDRYHSLHTRLFAAKNDIDMFLLELPEELARE